MTEGEVNQTVEYLREDACVSCIFNSFFLGGNEIFHPEAKKSVLGVLDDLAAVDAEPVRRGEWINKTEMRHGICDYRFDCSECSHIFWAGGVETFNFCPNCGAKMRGDNDAVD